MQTPHAMRLGADKQIHVCALPSISSDAGSVADSCDTIPTTKSLPPPAFLFDRSPKPSRSTEGKLLNWSCRLLFDMYVHCSHWIIQNVLYKARIKPSNTSREAQKCLSTSRDASPSGVRPGPLCDVRHCQAHGSVPSAGRRGRGAGALRPAWRSGRCCGSIVSHVRPNKMSGSQCRAQ